MPVCTVLTGSTGFSVIIGIVHMVSTCLQLLDRISVLLLEHYFITIILGLLCTTSFFTEEFSEDSLTSSSTLSSGLSSSWLSFLFIIIPFCIALLIVGSEGETSVISLYFMNTILNSEFEKK